MNAKKNKKYHAGRDITIINNNGGTNNSISNEKSDKSEYKNSSMGKDDEVPDRQNFQKTDEKKHQWRIVPTIADILTIYPYIKKIAALLISFTLIVVFYIGAWAKVPMHSNNGNKGKIPLTVTEEEKDVIKEENDGNTTDPEIDETGNTEDLGEEETTSAKEGEEITSTEDTGDTVDTVRDEAWTIRLVNPNWQPNVTDYSLLQEEVLFYNCEIEHIDIPLDSEYRQWNTPKANCSYSNADKKRYLAVEKKWKKLDSRLNNASKYPYMDEWEEIAPSDTEYLECIDELLRLSEASNKGRTGTYKAWFDAANLYLKLAAEYQVQTDNEQAVTYYYMRSIQCTMRALSYAQSGKTKWNKTYEYLYARYKELADGRTHTESEVKKRAGRIGECLQDWECDLFR